MGLEHGMLLKDMGSTGFTEKIRSKKRFEEKEVN